MLAVVAAVTAGLQLVYSGAEYAAGVVFTSSDERSVPPLTPNQVLNPPRAGVPDRLPQGRMIDTFPKNPRRITYVEPNPVVKIINPDAVLPEGIEEAYLKRLSRGFQVRTLGMQSRAWELDPNLKVTRNPAPRAYLPHSNITPTPCLQQQEKELHHR